MENILRGIVVLIGIGLVLYALYWLAFLVYGAFLIVCTIFSPRVLIPILGVGLIVAAIVGFVWLIGWIAGKL